MHGITLAVDAKNVFPGPARDAALKKADGIEKRGRKAKKRPIDAVSPETHPPINGKEEGRVGVVIKQEGSF